MSIGQAHFLAISLRVGGPGVHLQMSSCLETSLALVFFVGWASGAFLTSNFLGVHMGGHCRAGFGIQGPCKKKSLFKKRKPLQKLLREGQGSEIRVRFTEVRSARTEGGRGGECRQTQGWTALCKMQMDSTAHRSVSKCVFLKNPTVKLDPFDVTIVAPPRGLAGLGRRTGGRCTGWAAPPRWGSS